MNNLFSLENPLMRFLARVFDMIVSNALFLICCVPVVTAGAAIKNTIYNMLHELGA